MITKNPYQDNRHTSLRTLAMPADSNPSGDIFGGWLMSQMDIAGGFYARQLSKSRVVTVAVEAMTFHLPVFVGDEVSCYCETERLGRTSIAVHVETWVRRDQLSDDSIKVTEAVYTYVAIDEDRKPIPIKKPES
ncbi:acyl-CoA thioesterase [Cocleimonas flava]|uniref:Acyl-CoA thioesterase YciA n=1 Tax=Cocleimonas flava TaxID=634765 RepID=A0A4R1FCK1_9GAMM|nr:MULTISPECIES: acyl-CoA thioesterase [Cocleimonas]MEB8430813.1 acyl-CoA thioesterase [Cocleimonas sp. KMM 6892]MEC4714415.1 acyl-CoA thioesterase [Cocleimonas sp. KMM 6895]MEC4743746.1 acyl-CoA thioesterase [Cocleimonas sp. KMM 6896]TCJ88511.1 acyl-CoA thioesterase YciA [Cocleimonas flava]